MAKFPPNSLKEAVCIRKSKLNLSSSEMLSGRCFLTADLLTDMETSRLLQQITHLGTLRHDLHECGKKILLFSGTEHDCQLKVCPTAQVLIRTWVGALLQDQPTPRRKAPSAALSSTPSAVEAQAMASWIHPSRVKPKSPEPPEKQEPTQLTHL